MKFESTSRGFARCARVLRPNFLSEAEQIDLIQMTETGMHGQAHDNGKTAFAPMAHSSVRYLGSRDRDHFASLTARVKAQLEIEFGVAQLYSAGALLMRIYAREQIPASLLDRDPLHEYWATHSDMAAQPSYDYTALVYLNSHCHEHDGLGGDPSVCVYDRASARQPHFAGGEFVWNDGAVDHIVEPRGGQLIMFTGGTENMHQVRYVTRGTRYAIGMWYTCDELRMYQG